MEKISSRNKPRLEYIDLAKGICIFLVLLFHLCSSMDVECPLNSYIALFRMPLYFFLSGCFFKPYDGFYDFIKRKTNKLLIPFFFAYISFSFLTPYLLSYYDKTEWTTLPLSRVFIAWTGRDYPIVAVWFLMCLFTMNLIFYILYLLSKHSKYPTIVLIVESVVCGLSAYYLDFMHTKRMYIIFRAFQAIPFFLFGYIVFRKTNILKPMKQDRFLPLYVLLCFGLLVVFKSLKGSLGWGSTYLCGLFGTLGVILIAKAIKKLPTFSYFGRYSIMILMTHIVVFKIYKAICFMCGLSTMPTLVISLALTWFSYYLIIPFMRKYLPYVTAQKDVIAVNKQ